MIMVLLSGEFSIQHRFKKGEEQAVSELTVR
jgi:hypothetical protein